MVIVSSLIALGGSVLALVGVNTAYLGVLAAVGAATHLVLGAAMRALMPKPRATSVANRGYQVNSRGAALDHQIIYGQVRTGGVIVYDEATGNNNQYLHRVIAVAGHEVEDFVEFYLNGEEVTVNGSGVVTAPAKYANKVVIRTKSGTDTQAAESSLVASSAGLWTTNHRLRGIAYMYVEFTYDADAFPNGVPTVTTLVKGKKVKDPSTGTVAWSDNPALCLRDYLTNTGYGLGEEAANIDDDLVAAAKTVCDTHINGKDKFSCNGVFTTAEIPSDIMEDVLSSMGGSLWYSQGKWRMKPAYWTNSALALNEDDLRSSISVSTRHSRRDNFNVVKGTFRGEESNWEVTDYPQVTNNAFLVADNGQESVVDVDLPFTSTFVEARRLARITLESNRQQLVVTAAFGLRALEVQVGDNITLTNSRFGWQDKEFEVISWTFGLVEGLDLQVNLTLKETAESIFDEVDDGAVYEKDNTNLPDPFLSVASGISLSSELSIVNEEVVGVLVVDLTGSVGGFSSDYEVEYKPSGSSEYIFVGRSSSRQFRVNFIQDGYYDVRTRTINIFNVKSPYATVENWYSSAFSEPPENVQNFTGNAVGSLIHLNWKAVADLDLSHYKIRYSKKTVGALYQNSTSLVEKVSRPAVSVTVPARSGTYFIKAVDKLGNLSEADASFVVSTDVAGVEALNVVQLLEDDPDFLGVKSNVEVIGGQLIDGLTLTDRTALSGIYYFENEFDLGAKFTSRIQIDMEVALLDYITTFDAATGLFDVREGDFDGDPTKFDLIDVRGQVSFTDDDPSGTPTWSDWQDLTVSDITARAFRFRVILETQSEGMAPAITSLSATVDMPDRVASDNDITYTGSKAVTFPVEFKEAPALGIAATLANGDRYEISNKTSSGFTITTYTGTSVSTNSTIFDYVAKGYGRKVV